MQQKKDPHAGASRHSGHQEVHFISAHLPMSWALLVTCIASASALPHAQTLIRHYEAQGRTHKGGILIALADNKLKSFGHKCDDDECGPKEKSDGGAIEGAEAPQAPQAPSFFQSGSSVQPKAVDAEAEGTDGSEGSDGMLEAATPTAATMTEVFPEAEHVKKTGGSLLQISPRSAGTPAREGGQVQQAASVNGVNESTADVSQEEVMAAMREAVKTLQAKEQSDAVDTVVNALKDDVGAQDPTFNANSSHVTLEDPVLAALEDGIGAQEPSAAPLHTRVSAVTQQENVSASDGSVVTVNHSSLPVQARALLPPEAKSFVEHVLPSVVDVASQAEGRRSFWSTRSGALAAAVGFVAATWLAVICMATGFWMAVFSGWRSDNKGSLRSTIEAQRRSRATDLQKLMPSSGGYDCAFSKPVSSKQLLRLEVKIEGPDTGLAALRAPLTGRQCVLHSAAVSKQLHDGMPAVPVAFSASSVDFIVSLLDEKETRIHIKGEDVSLFDTVNGKCIERTTFDSAPDSWQDFVLTHRSAAPQGQEWAASSSLRADDASLEFQEASLLVGSTVTVIGELHRGVDGQLSMKPWQGEVQTSWRGKKLREPWRTSWERGCDEKGSRSSTPEVLKQKVFISDDEKLLATKEPEVEGKLRECAGGLGNFLG